MIFKGLHSRLWQAYGLAFVAMLCLTGVNVLWVSWMGYWSVALIFLLGVMALACVLPLYPALFSAAMSTLCWNIFFIPPVFDVQILNVQDMLMCCTYFIVALLITALTRRIRAQEERVSQREQRLNALYQFSQKLVVATDQETLLGLAQVEIAQALKAQVRFCVLPQEAKQLERTASAFVRTVTLSTAQGTHGYWVVQREEAWDQDQQAFLDTVSRHVALALEREALRVMATQHAVDRLSERLYDTLLDSVSHELRTPLTIIQCVLANLQQPDILEQAHWRQSLLEDLESAGLRLDHLVANLLDMSRLQSGRFQLNRDWCAPMDVVQAVVKALQHALKAYPVSIETREPLPLLYVDFALLEQALLNVLHNACTHNEPGTPITLVCGADAHSFYFRVEDQGPGIHESQWASLFEKFYRRPGSTSPGTGLGLSIAQGFMRAHEGEITVSQRAGGGTCFCLFLPLAPVPQIPMEVDDVTAYSYCG